MPTDPRAQHVGACVAMAAKYNEPAPPRAPYDGSLSAWMTGGSGAGNIAPTQLASYVLQIDDSSQEPVANVDVLQILTLAACIPQQRSISRLAGCCQPILNDTYSGTPRSYRFSYSS